MRSIYFIISTVQKSVCCCISFARFRNYIFFLAKASISGWQYDIAIKPFGHFTKFASNLALCNSLIPLPVAYPKSIRFCLFLLCYLTKYSKPKNDFVSMLLIFCLTFVWCLMVGKCMSICMLTPSNSTR